MELMELGMVWLSIGDVILRWEGEVGLYASNWVEHEYGIVFLIFRVSYQSFFML